MRIAPVSLNQQHKSQSFGTLHFELDKPSRELYVQMCKDRGYSEEKIVECIGALDKTVSEMEGKVDDQVQWFLNQSPATIYLLAHDVWPEKTTVPLSIKKVKADENNDDLIATIDGRHSVVASDIDLYKPYSASRRYNEIDYRGFIYGLPKVDFIVDELVIPNVMSKPLYQQAMKEYSARAEMDEESKSESFNKDINEWIG